MKKRQALTDVMKSMLVRIACKRDRQIFPYCTEVGTCRALAARGYLVLLEPGGKKYEMTQAGRDWVANNSDGGP